MLAYLFVIFAVVARMPFMPHPWNFTPVAAALLYFGARGSRRQLWVPFALLAASDIILTKFVYSYPLTWDQLVVWVWYAAILLLGTRLSENANWLRIGGAASALRRQWGCPVTLGAQLRLDRALARAREALGKRSRPRRGTRARQ